MSLMQFSMRNTAVIHNRLVVTVSVRHILDRNIEIAKSDLRQGILVGHQPYSNCFSKAMGSQYDTSLVQFGVQNVAAVSGTGLIITEGASSVGLKLE